MLPFVNNADIMPISALHYAPIVQVSVGLTNAQGVENKARRTYSYLRAATIVGYSFPIGLLFASLSYTGRTLFVLPRWGETR